MRLTSSIFVSALLRRVSQSGGFGAILRRGNSEAGAIFIVVRRRDGTIALYGPAPQLSYGDTRGERQFSLIADPLDEMALGTRLEREQRFDSDLWVVEIEPGSKGLGEFVALAGQSPDPA